tara:strand:+ start:1858 stop:2802 length:945 start_codon:yes stop_codon:yes gene_type:complete
MENIAILMGGYSKEKDISFKSAQTIYHYIDQAKYSAYKVVCEENNEFFVVNSNAKILVDNSDFSFVTGSKKIKFHKVFMMIHGAPGENGALCQYFDKQQIPYTSCSENISKLTFHKFKCNNYLKSLGYQVPISHVFNEKCEIDFPCIVKPACSGSSFGISKVYNSVEFKIAINEAQQYDQDVIIEEFIDGREVTCAVFNQNHIIKTLPITEIISENDIFDYDAKYNGKSIEKTPANLNLDTQTSIENIAKNIYHDLKLSGIVRIDFIIKKNVPYIIEINTVPGFSEESIVPQMLKCAKINLTNFITSELERLDI